MLLHLIKLCIFVIINYIFLYFILLQFNSNFRALELSKKLYVIKNLIKSYLLAFISVTGAIKFYESFLTNKFDNIWIRQYANLYVVNDLMALILVPNLPKTTKIHHITSFILLLYCYTIDFNDERTPGKLLIIYTLFSAFAFLVNFYLGGRFLIKKNDTTFLKKIVDKSKKIAYYIYIICCSINWLLHLVFILDIIINNLFNKHYFIYSFVIFLIVSDDLVLMSWLKN